MNDLVTIEEIIEYCLKYDYINELAEATQKEIDSLRAKIKELEEFKRQHTEQIQYHIDLNNESN